METSPSSDYQLTIQGRPFTYEPVAGLKRSVAYMLHSARGTAYLATPHFEGDDHTFRVLSSSFRQLRIDGKAVFLSDARGILEESTPGWCKAKSR